MNNKNTNSLEEGDEIRLDFTKIRSIGKIDSNVIPVVVQDVKTLEVLIIAYVNDAALEYSIKHEIAAFWSTSRNELWVKGKTSGDWLDLVEIRINCEQNSLLYLVSPQKKGACHTEDQNGNKRKSCFYRRIKNGKLELIN